MNCRTLCNISKQTLALHFSSTKHALRVSTDDNTVIVIGHQVEADVENYDKVTSSGHYVDTDVDTLQHDSRRKSRNKH